ncbi:MAG: toll/interleukin-1 receptor domain-containing protein [Prevotella sp.]|nr:toll/interleukin-1 receptor domain-containing protein [Prevotella sp.]
MEQEYKYFAFISYNSRDTEWGKRVQRKLEHYRLPATLCSEHGWSRRPMKPVFFAPTDIQPGGLTAELQERLRALRSLIVICSPNSARSEWVGREIEFFHSLGRTEQIHFFIVGGQPHSGNPDTECFNPVVGRLGLPEILGANVHERIYRWPWLNRVRAYVQLVSKLLGVEFDAIWQRHRRRLVRRAIAWTVGMVAVVAALLGVWLASQPVSVKVSLRESSVHSEMLPPLRDAVVTMALLGETKTDTIRTADGSVVMANIPGRFLNKEVRVSVRCRDYLPVDTVLTLQKDVSIAVRRDEAVYGRVAVRLWDAEAERPVAGATVVVEGREAVSDAEGRVCLQVPLAEQRPAYRVRASVPLETDSIYMPCGEDDVIIIEN